MKFSEQLPIWNELSSIHVPNQLTHFDSDFCWCDPIVELDENGRPVVIHKEVTWN